MAIYRESTHETGQFSKSEGIHWMHIWLYHATCPISIRRKLCAEVCGGFIMTYPNLDPKPVEHDPSLSSSEVDKGNICTNLQETAILCTVKHNLQKIEHIILLFAMHLLRIPYFDTPKSYRLIQSCQIPPWLMVGSPASCSGTLW